MVDSTSLDANSMLTAFFSIFFEYFGIYPSTDPDAPADLPPNNLVRGGNGRLGSRSTTISFTMTGLDDEDDKDFCILEDSGRLPP